MASDLATKVPTQQSVKAYVDAAASGISNVVEDTTPQLGGNLDGQGNDITSLGTVSMTEQAAANADVAGEGQWWVKTATPNIPMFTNDAGSDFQLQYQPSEGGFADGDKTKLDGIEASADVTDTTNVTAAGALMDSELTDLTAVKTLSAPDNTTISTFGATLVDDTNAATARGTLELGAGDSPQFTALTVDSGNISLASGNLEVTTGAGITDDSSNEQLMFSTTGSAVNYVQIANAATGNGPEIQAQGGDADVDIELIPKGSGEVKVGANAVIDAGDTASATVAGIVELATDAETTTGTATDRAITPANLASQNFLQNISEDTTPQLGGELDCGANSIGFTMQTATGDGTTTVDWGNGNHFKFTFGAFNETFTFTAPAKPGVFTMILVQDSVGSRTATWPASVKFPGGTAPTLTTTATTGTDVLSFLYDGTNYLCTSTLNFS